MRIVTGMQAGADRGAADAALACGLHVSGYVPKGRLAEDGRIPTHYNCIELPTNDYGARTKANVLAAHATVIFTHGPFLAATSGSKLTRTLCLANMRPVKHVDLSGLTGPTSQTIREHMVMDLGEWFNAIEGIFSEHEPLIVNIVCSRESKAPGIQEEVRSLLEEVFRVYKVHQGPNSRNR